MDSVQVNVGGSLSGAFKGTTGNPNRRSPLNYQTAQAMTQGGTGATLCDQAIDRTAQAVTLAGTTTLDLDLRNAGSTYVNPIGEVISVANSNNFAKVRSLKVQHLSTSTATTGVRLFAATTDSFQANLASGDSLTLKPGEALGIDSFTAAGLTVDATHRLFTMVNLDANAAQVKFFVGGSTS